MRLFNKTDMVYEGYQWTAYPNDNPKITGNPASTRFNRHEGYEVLYLINIFAKEWNLIQIRDCQKIEKIIHERLPSNIIMQIEVKNWVKENWNNY
jgi:hypothetical protein